LKVFYLKLQCLYLGTLPKDLDAKVWLLALTELKDCTYFKSASKIVGWLPFDQGANFLWFIDFLGQNLVLHYLLKILLVQIKLVLVSQVILLQPFQEFDQIQIGTMPWVLDFTKSSTLAILLQSSKATSFSFYLLTLVLPLLVFFSLKVSISNTTTALNFVTYAPLMLTASKSTPR